VEFCVDERDAYLREQKKSRLDYEKSAILIFAQNPQLSEIEFRFLGNQLNWGVGYTNETVYFRRDELERRCGPLAFTAHGTLEEQAQVWFAKAETAGFAEPGGQPVLEFDEKLRRLEWYYDDEKSKAHYDKNETYLQLRFSLLPDKAPDDGGCYLQMEFVQPDGELRTAERNTSAIWIYGEQARWQQLTAPTAVQKEAHTYDTAREILCSGEYQIVVSRWDKQLRAGLEALGGQIVEEQSTPWSVVYKGTLVFQQQIS